MSAYSTLILGTNGLQAYYRLDEMGGATAADSKGANPGIYVNTAGLTRGQTGLLTGDTDACPVFNSASRGCVSLPVGLAPTGLNPFTLECWIYPTNSSRGIQRIISNDNGNGAALLYDGPSNQIRAWHANYAVVLTAKLSSPSTNTIYHIAYSYDGYSLRLYVNGNCRGVIFEHTSISARGSYFCIGADGNTTDNFDGKIDEVAIYNTALDGSTVRNHYRTGINYALAANTNAHWYGAYVNNGVDWQANAPTYYSELTQWTNWATNNGSSSHNPGIFHAFPSWGNTPHFPLASAQEVNRLGADLFVTWQAMDSGAVKPGGGFQPDQPTYGLKNIINGALDAYLNTWATEVKSYGQPVFIRMFHEFNGDFYPWGTVQDANNGNQSDYIYGGVLTVNTEALVAQAWIHVWTVFQNAGVTNVKWVWCPTVFDDNFANPFTMAAYPGDAYVDYVGLDGYNTQTNGSTGFWQHPFDIFSQSYDVIRAVTSKPMILPELAFTEDSSGVYSKASDITQFFGIDVPNSFQSIVGFQWENDSHYAPNLSINSSSSALAAFQAQVASGLYAGGTPLPVASIPTSISISGLSPASTTTASGPFTLAVNGSGFQPTSVVDFAGVAQTTTFVGVSQLTATLSAESISTAGTNAVTVTTPNYPTTNAVNFTVSNAAPSLVSLAPNSVAVNSGAQTISITGSNFVSGCTAQINGQGRVTGFSSSTSVTIGLLSGDAGTAGTFPVTVSNPGAPVSGALNLTVVASPALAISSISPSSEPQGSAAFTLTVNGTGFQPTSVVNFAGAAQPTTYASSSQLTATIGTGAISTAGTYVVTVTSPNNPTTNAVNFTVNSVVPTLASLTPNSVAIGSGAQAVSITGSDFISGCIVQFNGQNRTISFSSSTAVSVDLVSGDFEAAGTFPVTVSNPGSSASGALNLTVVASAKLAISSISPASVPQGSAAFTLTVNGTGFVPGSIVRWNGTALTTNYVDASQLKAQVLTRDLLIVRTSSITVLNP